MATKNIVPNADSEGGIGTSSKYWATGYIDAITTTGNLVIGGSIDLEGDIDVNGTTNLDIVDIDGAVNMATTALVTGVLTTTAATVFNGGFTSNAASTISTADNLDTLSLISTDADANAGPNLRLFRNSASPADSDVVGLVEFEGKNSAGTTVRWAGIESKIVDVTDSTEDGSLELVTTLAGSGAVSRILMNATETVINESSKDLDFRVESDNLTNAFFVQGSDGNVGIGVTPFPQNLIAGSLDLNGGASIFGYDKRAYLASNVYYQGGWKVKEAGYGAFMLVGLTNGDFGFYTTTQGTSANATVTDSRSLHISSGGAATFSTGANRTLIIGKDSVDTGYNVVSLNGTTTKGSYSGIAGGGTSDNNLYLNSANNVVVQTGSGFSPSLTITSGGTVQVYGTASANALSIDHSSSNDVLISIPFQSVNQDFVIRNSSAGVNLDYAATSWVSASDENIKENITSLDNVLDKIKNIRCVNYNLKDEEIYKKRLGFIAQDFQNDFEEVTSRDNDDVLGLRYTETIPILMKAIQEQQTIIEDLKARIETLEG